MIQLSSSLRLSILSLILLFSLCTTSYGTAPEDYIGQGGNLSALQMHAMFFDRNKDGVIYPWETREGLRAIGCGQALAASGAVIINGFLASRTAPGSTSPLLPIYVKNIKKGKHGSDTGVYDTEGRFVPAKFEEIFQKYAKTSPTALTSQELQKMLQANRDPNDYQGWFASSLEWKILYNLGKDRNGMLEKETIRAAYDGSVFPMLEKKAASKSD